MTVGQLNTLAPLSYLNTYTKFYCFSALAVAVVDPSLKVLGTQKLRVIDASVMPKIIGGNTNAATVMIGEKGADMIIKQYQGCVEEKEYCKDEL